MQVNANEISIFWEFQWLNYILILSKVYSAKTPLWYHQTSLSNMYIENNLAITDILKFLPSFSEWQNKEKQITQLL